MGEQKIKKIMAYQCDWNDEIIVQFYATLYVEDSDGDARNWKMHWMIEGTWYSVGYLQFGRLSGFVTSDLNHSKLNNDIALLHKETKIMYEQGHFGTVKACTRSTHIFIACLG